MMGWAREREADEKIYLDADAVLECFHAWRDRHGDVHEPEEMEEFQKILALPAADVRENRRGKWKPYLPEGLRYQCSECGSRYEIPWHFCPNCGADMRGERA